VSSATAGSSVRGRPTLRHLTHGRKAVNQTHAERSRLRVGYTLFVSVRNSVTTLLIGTLHLILDWKWGRLRVPARRASDGRRLSAMRLRNCIRRQRWQIGTAVAAKRRTLCSMLIMGSGFGK